ncbi:MAG: hypothetical protein K0R29_1507 [Pseudobdellovibrio sp.]|nr:hypothetical protein [Pseudobdellovibrio sp.]
MIKYVSSLLMVVFGLNTSFAGEVAVPIHVSNIEGTQSAGGAISVAPTQQNPNALEILRAELERLEQQAQKRSAKDGVFISTTKRFAPESITFFIAMGAVTFNSMWIKSHGDPLALERHIMSLKDPIAHLSFYTFMQTQGFYMNFHTRTERFSKLDPSTRAQMMRRLSYQGMAVGSLASSIVADLGHSVKMCVNKWLKGKRDDASLESCNHAWGQWTVRNKFTQYFPQIISMWASQMATEFLENKARWGFQKISGASWAQKMLNRKTLVNMAYKITGADVATTFVGGGWVTKSIKFVGKVTRFAGFVAVDHIISNFTYRPINNLIQPALFESNALKVGLLWHQADSGNWDESRIADKNVSEFEEEIEDYGRRMQQWRDHLNMDAEADLAGWMEMTKRILSQVEYAYNFYRNFVGEMNTTLNTFYLVGQKKLNESATENISMYPIRPLYLYGVKLGTCQTAGPVQDYYMLRPDVIEQCQRDHIKSVIPRIVRPSIPLKGTDLAKYNKFVNDLKSTRLFAMGTALKEMQSQIAIYEIQSRDPEMRMPMYGAGYIQALKDIIKHVGDAQPHIEKYSGFTKAFEIQTANQALEEQADFGRFSLKYAFNKIPDLMFYKLICGEQNGKLETTRLAGVNIFHPKFSPPSLLKPNADRAAFCSSADPRMYSKKVGDKDLHDYISKNLNMAAFGDLRGDQPASAVHFERWWMQHAKAPISGEFAYYDQQYRKVVQKAYNNYFDNRGWYKYIVDGLNRSLYLPKSTEKSLNAEANLYLQILNRAMLARAPVPNRGTDMPGEEQGWLSWIGDQLSRVTIQTSIKDVMLPFDYVEYATKSSQEEGFPNMYGHTVAEVNHLNNLLKYYSNFFKATNLNFDEYIKHSKRVDNTIHLILVKLGLEKEVAVPAEAVEDFSQPATSGTENTPKSYEPVQVQNPSYKQRVAIAAIRGIRQVEAEIRRYIRMKVALKHMLQVNDREILNDWNQTTGNRVSPAGANPFGRH